MSIEFTLLLQDAMGKLQVLLGQGRLSSLSRNFRGTSDTTSFLVIVFVVTAAIAFLGWLAFRYFSVNEDKKHCCPNRLFKKLCRVHELSWSDSALLRKLSLCHHLASPAEIFINPRLLDIQPGSQRSMMAQIDAIREKLFGSEPS